jgi:hypothetical protein
MKTIYHFSPQLFQILKLWSITLLILLSKSLVQLQFNCAWSVNQSPILLHLLLIPLQLRLWTEKSPTPVLALQIHGNHLIGQIWWEHQYRLTSQTGVYSAVYNFFITFYSTFPLSNDDREARKRRQRIQQEEYQARLKAGLVNSSSGGKLSAVVS